MSYYKIEYPQVSLNTSNASGIGYNPEYFTGVSTASSTMTTNNLTLTNTTLSQTTNVIGTSCSINTSSTSITNPTISSGTLTNSTLTTPTITGGTLTSCTSTSATLNNPTITGQVSTNTSDLLIDGNANKLIIGSGATTFTTIQTGGTYNNNLANLSLYTKNAGVINLGSNGLNVSSQININSRNQAINIGCANQTSNINIGSIGASSTGSVYICSDTLSTGTCNIGSTSQAVNINGSSTFSQPINTQGITCNANQVFGTTSANTMTCNATPTFKTPIVLQSNPTAGTQLGYTANNTSSASTITSGTFTNAGNITIPNAGIWIVLWTANIATASSATITFADVGASTSSSAWSSAYFHNQFNNAGGQQISSAGNHSIRGEFVYTATASQTFYLDYQITLSAGSATCTFMTTYVRVG